MKLGIIKKTAMLSAVLTLTLAFSGCGYVKGEINKELSSARSEIASAMEEAREEVSSALDEAREEVSSALDEAREEVSSALDEAHTDVAGALDEVQENLLGTLDTVKPSSETAESKTDEAAKTDENTDTTTAPTEEVWYTFRTQKLFDDHYQKHGAEFGDITQEEYLKLANELIADTSDNILHKREKEDNDYLYFNKTNNYFLVLSTDGYIRTFFIPSAGINYWERQ